MSRYYIYVPQGSLRRKHFRLYLPRRVWWWVQYSGNRSHARFSGGIRG